MRTFFLKCGNIEVHAGHRTGMMDPDEEIWCMGVRRHEHDV